MKCKECVFEWFKKHAYIVIIVFGMILISVVLYILLSWEFRNQESNIVRNVIKEQAKTDLLLPPLILSDLRNEKEIREELNKRVIEYLSIYYSSNDIQNQNRIKIKPYFIYPAKDYSGKYVFTEQQFKELQEHINFLVKQIDEAIKTSKEEVNKDIDRLNLWFSIWIGILGLLGVFVPIGLNAWNRSEFNKIKDDSKESKKRADEASFKSTEVKSLLEKYQPTIDKIDPLEQRIYNIDTKVQKSEDLITSAINHAETAKKDSEQARIDIEKTNKLLASIHSISKLNAFDPINLIHIQSDDRIKIFLKYLKNINDELLNCSTFSDNDIINDCLNQLALRMYYISLSDFIDNNVFTLLQTFSKDVAENIDQISERSIYNDIMSELSNLISSIEQLSKSSPEPQ